MTLRFLNQVGFAHGTDSPFFAFLTLQLISCGRSLSILLLWWPDKKNSRIATFESTLRNDYITRLFYNIAVHLHFWRNSFSMLLNFSTSRLFEHIWLFNYWNWLRISSFHFDRDSFLLMRFDIFWFVTLWPSFSNLLDLFHFDVWYNLICLAKLIRTNLEEI